MSSFLYIAGMHGLGDNLHQRAIIRQLLPRHQIIALETSWPCIYHDLIGPQLRLVFKRTALRTQTKNAQREYSKYVLNESQAVMRDGHLRILYKPETVRAQGSVLAAMLVNCGLDPSRYDFRLPIPPEWDAKAQAWLERWQPTKPLMLYRPLVDRREWGGCAARNPDFAAYAVLYQTLRKRYFVISLADLVPQIEWTVGVPVETDVQFHHGELDFETIAALTARAALVYASPGFAIPLAQAVGTPSICVFGGYENSASFSLGAKLTPHLGIDPIKPCQCFQHHHDCQKKIDLPPAIERIERFLECLSPPSPRPA